MMVEVEALGDDWRTPLELVEAVRALPYGRPSERTVAGMLREGLGTCSTKHLFLAEALADRFPDTEPQIVHRVYRLDRDTARQMFGQSVAQAVPLEGITDVHRYLLATINGSRVTLDATFPGPPWDGASPMELACGPGRDYLAGRDPDAEKRALEAQHCDPHVREPFIAALNNDGVTPAGGAAYRAHCTFIAESAARSGQEL